MWNNFASFVASLFLARVNEQLPIFKLFNRFNPSILNIFTDWKQLSPISIDSTKVKMERSSIVNSFWLQLLSGITSVVIVVSSKRISSISSGSILASSLLISKHLFGTKLTQLVMVLDRTSSNEWGRSTFRRFGISKYNQSSIFGTTFQCHWTRIFETIPLRIDGC